MYKTIPGFDNYEINEFGIIHNKKSGHTITLFQNAAGYKCVSLSCGSKGNRITKTMLVHRLVLLTFLGPSELSVNHLDGNKSNNHISNLEYCSMRDNIHHSFKTGLNSKKAPKKVGAYLGNKLIFHFNSTYEASCITGFSQGNISAAASGKALSYKGYTWKYI